MNTGFSYTTGADIGVVTEQQMAQDMWEVICVVLLFADRVCLFVCRCFKTSSKNTRNICVCPSMCVSCSSVCSCFHHRSLANPTPDTVCFYFLGFSDLCCCADIPALAVRIFEANQKGEGLRINLQVCVLAAFSMMIVFAGSCDRQRSG